MNQFITSHNYKYLISSGKEGMIKIWDLKMIFNIPSHLKMLNEKSILMENSIMSGKSTKVKNLKKYY